MRLFEAIVDANQRAARGENAGLRPADFADFLPIVALSCIDPRLNPLLPEVLGIPDEHFIWLRNAGNIITGPMSSTMRSLALACPVKAGREIVVIGHTDCRVRQTSSAELLDRFRALGIERARLPDNLNEFFGLFASERQNVIKAAGFVRQSPLIGPAIPVHGMLVDIRTGQIECLVNGYNALEITAAGVTQEWNLPSFDLGSMKFPETKIGEITTHAEPVPSPATVPPARSLKPMPPASIPVPPRILHRHPKQR